MLTFTNKIVIKREGKFIKLVASPFTKSFTVLPNKLLYMETNLPSDTKLDVYARRALVISLKSLNLELLHIGSNKGSMWLKVNNLTTTPVTLPTNYQLIESNNFNMDIAFNDYANK
jgi:hypothetical protein